MAPHRPPRTLKDFCIERCMLLIYTACVNIDLRFRHPNDYRRYDAAWGVNAHLMSMLPARMFDVFSENRRLRRPPGDPAIQVIIVMHPKLRTLRHVFAERLIPETFWINMISKLNFLVVLDIELISSDEIVKVAGIYCPLLEELYIGSQIEVHFYPFYPTYPKVTNETLRYINNLKKLRVLSIDLPDYDYPNPGRHAVSRPEVFSLLRGLPCLEIFYMKSWNIASLLMSSTQDVGPISIRKIRITYPSAEGIRHVFRTCPYLNDLSLLDLRPQDQDAVLQEISMSQLRLNKFEVSLSFFSTSMENLLNVKGRYITDLSLFDTNSTFNFGHIILIGECCPNLATFKVSTNSDQLNIPHNYKPSNIFTKLRELKLGDDFGLANWLSFFCECTDDSLETLTLKHRLWTDVNGIFRNLLNRGCLKNVNTLQLGSRLIISEDTVIEIIKNCDSLNWFAIKFHRELANAWRYVHNNNLAVKLGSC